MPASTKNYDQLLKEALLALRKEKTRVAELESIGKEPIAIVGMGCRFPGDACDVESFWNSLLCGVDAVSEDRGRRWKPDPHTSDKSIPAWGGFIDDGLITDFDAEFFGIVPREAALLDPQHRLALETAWEAIENAGIAPGSLSSRSVGVYVGVMFNDYYQKACEGTPDFYAASGGILGGAAGRVSYFLGLRGPSMAIDTACSSSLVAVHEACAALRNRTCEIALAGGVNVLLSTRMQELQALGGMLSPRGRCRTFDASADGIVRGEGCGMVVLKRLSDAISQNDRIIALIRGSAVNHNGRSSGFTVPNGEAQRELLQAALEVAQMRADRVTYLEAHGTGTPLGDPIELAAAAAIYCHSRDKDNLLRVGSVKTNLGHLESASGIAGLMKAILALEHGMIPPHLHLETPNSKLNLEQLPIEIPKTPTPWHGAIPRCAAVSSFGLSGTNAHVILEEGPEVEPIKNERDRTEHLLVLSARTQPALDDLTRRYLDHLEGCSEHFADICHTAAVGRNHFTHRLSVVARDGEEALGTLRSYVQGVEEMSCDATGANPKIAFLFTGQGSQYVGMARQLFETQPQFRQTVERCEELFHEWTTQSLLEILYACDQNDPRIHQTGFAQPALYVIEAALADLWRSWGIRPAAVLGHSVGEYAGAYVAGVFSLEDGLRLITERGRLMQELPHGGGMAVVHASAEEIHPHLEPFSHRLTVATYNGLANTVLSGEEAALNELLSRLLAVGIGSTPLKVSHAFHSHLLEPMLPALSKAASQIEHRPPHLPFISNLTGETISAVHADYWREHARQPVRFMQAAQRLIELGIECFIEIGPRPVLLGLLRQMVTDDAALWLPSLRPARGDWRQLLTSLGQLYTRGARIDWHAFDRDYRRRRTALPNYPWQRKRYWIDTTKSPISSANTGNPLLGTRLDLASPPYVYRTQLSLSAHAHLCDHKIFDKTVFPGVGYLELALAAYTDALGRRPAWLSDIVFATPLVMTNDQTIEIQCALEVQENGHLRFRIHSRNARTNIEEWLLHATGTIRTEGNLPAIAEFQPNGIQDWTSPTQWYDAAESVGMCWGPAYRNIIAQSRQGKEWISFISNAERHDVTEGHEVHPTIFDACGHAILLNLYESDAPERICRIPLAIDSLWYSGIPLQFPCWARTRLQSTAWKPNDTVSSELTIYSESGQALLQASGIQVRPIHPESLNPSTTSDVRDSYTVSWKQLSAAASRSDMRDRRFLFVSHDDERFAEGLADELTRRGANCEHIDCRECGERRSLTWPLSGTELIIVLASNSTESLTVADFESQLCKCYGDLLQILERLAGSSTPPVRITVVTDRACPLDTDAHGLISLAVSGLPAFLDVASQEYPALQIRQIDSDGYESESLLALADALCRSSDETVQHLRGRSVWAPRIERRPIAATGEQWRPDANGTYLISGGLGGIGMEIAKWMVSSGVRRLLLVGRRPPTEAAKRSIELLKEADCQVDVENVDVAVPWEIEQLFSRLSTRGDQLRGIVHAAGSANRGLLSNTTTDEIIEAHRAKVLGGWNLHNASCNLALDLFVLVSSSAAWVPGIGQAAYAAANRALVGLAEHRRRKGLRVLCLAWGPWAEVGAAARSEELAGAIRHQGLAPLQPAAYLAGLAHFAGDSKVQVMHACVDWSHPRYGHSDTRIYSELARNERSHAISETRSGEFTDALQGYSSESLVTAIAERIAVLSSQVMGGARESAIARNRSLFDFGLDSIMAVEIRNRLNVEFGIALSATTLFNFPTIDQLADHIVSLPELKRLRKGTAGEDEPAPQEPITDEQALMLIDEVIDAMEIN